jgi:hypothetical protein
MFNRPTVFVVGAGASAEVDFPVGVTLARSIAEKMDVRFERGSQPIGAGDYGLYSHITGINPRDAQAYWHAAMRIRDGLPFAQSIDDFLDQHRSDQYVNLYGKAALAQAVVEGERGSKLFFNIAEGENTIDAAKIADTWFTRFMYMLCRGVPREEVRTVFENVAFIVFNYDRCIEHFLMHALSRAYAMELEEAAAIVRTVSIIHPYGAVGELSKVPFGASRIHAVNLAGGIKTYTEQVDVPAITGRINAELQKAECIVFLGFAFHSQNVRMLEVARDTRKNRIIYGTAFEMSAPDKQEVNRQLARTMHPNEIHLENLKCCKLFEHYAKSLTGGD